jgi:hypothetical protein
MPFHLGSSDLYDAVESIITTTTPANPRRAHTATLYVTVCIYQLPKPFLAILDGLEPAHIRLTSVFEHTSLYYYSYCQSIVRWKRLLLHYVPNATELIDVLAMLHRLLLQRILRSFGCMHSGTDRFSTLIAMVLVRYGILSLRLCESVNQDGVEHLDADLEHRFVFLCGTLGVTDPITTKNRYTRAEKSITAVRRVLGIRRFYRCLRVLAARSLQE